MRKPKKYVYESVIASMREVAGTKESLANALYELSGRDAYQGLSRIDKESLSDSAVTAKKNLKQALSEKQLMELLQKLGMFMVGNGL